MPARVLLATDLGEGSSRAAQVLVHVMEPDASVRVVHVVPFSPYEAALGNRHAPAADAQAVEAEVRAWCASVGLASAEARVLRGDVPRVLAQEAQALDAALVALGSHEENPLERALLGSVARSTVRRVQGREVLVARPRGQWPPRRILVASDFGEASDLAARRAAALAARHGAELLLAHAVDAGAFSAAVDPAGGPAPAVVSGAAERLLTEQASRALGGRGRRLVLHGRPAHEVAEAARTQEADLVVVGSHGPGPLERALLGSVAEGIVERAPVSVLVVGAPG